MYGAGLALLALLDVDSGCWLEVIVAVVQAVAGNSVRYVAPNVVDSCTPGQTNRASSVSCSTPGCGGGLEPTVMGVVAVRRIGVGSSVEALLAGYQAAFWTAVGIAAAGLLVAVFWVRQVRSDGPVTSG
ncbi:MAG: hypothetical protein M3513_07785 [Actinomycetota bacterium]|nr:hypothetical protein [Actinomycetota bacterium]